MVCVERNYTYLFEISTCDLVLIALSHLHPKQLVDLQKTEKRKGKNGLVFY